MIILGFRGSIPEANPEIFNVLEFSKEDETFLQLQYKGFDDCRILEFLDRTIAHSFKNVTFL